MKKLLIIALVIVGFALTNPTQAHAVLILDQEHAPAGTFGGLAVANDRQQFQNFTVGLTGQLAKVEVSVYRARNTIEDLDLSIWSLNVSGLPDTMLFSSSVAPSLVPLDDTGFVSFLLGTDAFNVYSGDQFGIMLFSDASNLSPYDQRYIWTRGEDYTGGSAYTIQGDSAALQSSDNFFRTYVDDEVLVGIVPEPTSLFLFGSGLFGFLFRRKIV